MSCETLIIGCGVYSVCSVAIARGPNVTGRCVGADKSGGEQGMFHSIELRGYAWTGT